MTLRWCNTTRRDFGRASWPAGGGTSDRPLRGPGAASHRKVPNGASPSLCAAASRARTDVGHCRPTW